MWQRLRSFEFPSLLTVALGVLVLMAAALTIQLVRTEASPRGNYVIGTNHSPPFQIVGADGTVKGPLVEIFELAAKRVGISLTWISVPKPPDSYLSDKASGIDLWPLAMKLPERLDRFYITEPYTGSHYVLFSKRDFSSNFEELPANLVIGHASFRYTANLFHQTFPHQRAYEAERPADLMNAVCEDRLDGAVVEVNAVEAFLQALPRNCGTERVFLKPVPNWSIDLGVAARFGREDVANALRQEIGQLARSGRLDPIFDKYLAMDRIRHRNLFVTTRHEANTQKMALALFFCVAVSLILAATLLVQRRKSRLAVSLAASKTAFLAAMSHEIRTPLTGVLGMTELLSDSNLDAQQASYLAHIRSAGERLLTIVNDVLTLSKLESGRMQFETAPVSPHALLHDVLPPLALLADRKKLEIVVDVAQDVPRSVTLDAVKAGQILTNLAGNAVKFTESGGIRLGLSVTGAPGIAQHLRFMITDTGVGIAPDDVGKIFESYRQAKNPTVAGGTGLGLPISRMMALQMGGFFGMSSEPGAGSTFWFELPLAASDKIPPAGECPMKPLANYTVVITTSASFLRKSLGEALSERGAQCLEWDSRGGVLNLEEMPPKKRLVFLADIAAQSGDSPRVPVEVTWTAARLSAPVVLLAAVCFRGETEPVEISENVWGCTKPVHVQNLVRLILKATQERSTGECNAAGERSDAAMISNSPLWALQESLGHSAELQSPVFHVLVAEDDRLNQRIMTAMLKKIGVTCEIANDGEEVVEMLDVRHFDLVFMDCRMPKRDGLEATIRIRVAGKRYSGIPIIGTSAELESIQRDCCLQAGMDGFLEKPYTRNELSAVLEPYMELARSRDGNRLHPA